MSNRINPRAQGGGTPSNPTVVSQPAPTAAARTAHTVTNVAAVPLLAVDPLRKGAILWNDGPAALFVGFGTPDVTASDYSIQIASGAFYELKFPQYTGVATGILGVLGSQTVRVTEFE